MVTKTNNPKISQWLEERCKRERLSLRQTAARTGLSHTTISDVIRGNHPSPETIRKLARGFAGDGTNEMLALEDQLLILGGYRTPRPEEKVSVAMATLMDRVRGLSQPQLEMMVSFAGFLREIEGEN